MSEYKNRVDVYFEKLVKYACCVDPDIRQAACFGLGVFAKRISDDEYSKYANRSLLML